MSLLLNSIFNAKFELPMFLVSIIFDTSHEYLVTGLDFKVGELGTWLGAQN